jgi:hypothetical protein
MMRVSFGAGGGGVNPGRSGDDSGAGALGVPEDDEHATSATVKATRVAVSFPMALLPH